jgi:GNAT superfamily N-acetyltransferase
MTEVVLRPATAADEDFLRDLYGTTRADELAVTGWTDEQQAAFVAMQFAAQAAYYRSTFPDATQDVVLVDGEPAGRLYVRRDPGVVGVVDVSIAPGFRGRGIGTMLLNGVLAEAAASGCRVSIHVERHNRARTLYERLGFVEVEDQGVYLRMEHVPPGTSPVS